MEKAQSRLSLWLRLNGHDNSDAYLRTVSDDQKTYKNTLRGVLKRVRRRKVIRGVMMIEKSF